MAGNNHRYAANRVGSVAFTILLSGVFAGTTPAVAELPLMVVLRTVETATQNGDSITIPGGTISLARIEKHEAVLLDCDSARVLSNDVTVIERAVESLTNAILDHPDNPDSLLARARFWEHTREHRLAFEDFDLALRLKPENDDIRERRVWNLVFGKMFEKAILECNAILDRSPMNADILFARGLARMTLRRFHKSKGLASITTRRPAPPTRSSCTGIFG